MPTPTQQRLQDLATRIGTQFKLLNTMINGNLPNLGTLATAAKGSLLLAINELKQRIDGKQDTLGFVPIDQTLIGAPNGIVPLDGTSKIPSIYFPSSIDDIVGFPLLANFPVVGERNKIYVESDNGDKQYRWSGAAYIEIVSAPGTTDAVAEGLANLYFTNARAVAALVPVLGDSDANLVAVFEAALA
jgi:hypothetical protein